MTKILVLYYSMYGHIEIMAKAVAEGVHSANADQILVSFKGNCVRGARFSRGRDPPFWETPEPMTTFAVSFMRNKAKNNSEM